jgi:uncharacterized protein
MTSDDTPSARFEQVTDVAAESPTLIEGLPGLGMVASIAVDRITDQLGLETHGHVRIDEFPPVTSFSEGRVRETIRVHAGTDPDVMTLQSDVPIPQPSVRALSRCVLDDLAEEFERAIFLAGAPAQTEQELGDVTGVATTDEIEEDLRYADIQLAEESGALGGVTGGLVSACYRDDVPAAVLIVRCDPRLPDPRAARSVIENALEPLVAFDIDTGELQEQAEKIQQQKQQVAEQLQQMLGGKETETTPDPSMYQ